MKKGESMLARVYEGIRTVVHVTYEAFPQFSRVLLMKIPAGYIEVAF